MARCQQFQEPMSLLPRQIEDMLARLRLSFSPSEAQRRVAPHPQDPPAPLIRAPRRPDIAGVRRLWAMLRARGAGAQDETCLASDAALAGIERYGANIENMIGFTTLPLGLAGPLRVNGLHAQGDYYLPLATTEAALVASYSRGCEIVTKAGGASAALTSEGVLRAPGFAFGGLGEAGLFIDWVARHAAVLGAAAEATSRYAKLLSLEPVLDNDIVFLLCRFATGDAAGQNMATIAADALCRHIEAHCPIKPRHWFVEANFSGDKKASFLGLLTGRGRKVTASVVLPAALVQGRLRVSVQCMLDYAGMANLGALLSGQIGAQGHYANGLAAFYIATGQDAACVAESAVGMTRMEARSADLLVSVTLPNILVGTVGGGTGLPAQAAALRLLGLAGAGKAAALAEVTAALCLAGEISIIGAMAAGEFTRAHRLLARGRG